MFARISTIIAILFFAMLVAASVQVVPRTDRVPLVDCAAGDVYCCNAVVGGSDNTVRLIAGLLGIVLGPIQGLVGLTCSPISIIGGGNSCSSQTVCCTGNDFSGLIVIDCSPININL